VRSRRANAARTATIALGQRDEDALRHVLRALGFQRARREPGGDADLGVFVASEPAQRRQHFQAAELGQVTHGREHDRSFGIAFEQRGRRFHRRRRADLGERCERRCRFVGVGFERRQQRGGRTLRAHAAERGDRRQPQRARTIRRQKPRDRALEPREAEAAGRVDSGFDDARIGVGQPAVHERHEPRVAKAAAHCAQQAGAFLRRIGVMRQVDQHPRRLVGGLRACVERGPGDVSQRAVRFDALRARRARVRCGGQRLERVIASERAALELPANRADVGTCTHGRRGYPRGRALAMPRRAAG
jgi:hypothetical protein